mgnify:FL=1
MKKIFSILFFCLFLGGCYSQGTISEDRSIINSNSGPKAFLNFIVVQDLQDIHTLLWAPKARVDIDGKKIAKLKKNQTTQISVTPGKHKISTKWDFGYTHVTLNFESGETYYFAIAVAPMKGAFQYGDRASLTKLSKEEWENYN